MTWTDKSLTTLSGIGLGYDIVGVIILAWGVFAAGHRDLQRRDVGFALALVVVGFALQFVGAGYSLRLDRASVLFAWLLLVLMTIAYFCLRKRGLKTDL